MKELDLEQTWKKTLAQIEIKIDAGATFKMFFMETKLLEIVKKTALIGVPNPYVMDWLSARYKSMIKDTLSFVYGTDINIDFKVYQKEKIEEESGTTNKVNSYGETNSLLSTQNGIMESVIDTIQKSGLNLKYSMANYIIGSSNRIAHAASLAVIEKPGEIYNPLFLYGKTGVGKTHLAQSIGRAVLERNLRKKVVYTASENFLNEMIKGIKTGKMDQFRKKYREVDILIIDDMQMISKWVHTKEEFFNTFNEMSNSGKQIIMIADRKPEDIKNIEGRLKTRMQGGMVVDVGQPDFEMRLAIVEKKAESTGVELPQKILEFIARTITESVRELEGALQKIALFNQMKPEGDLTLEEVAHTLGIDSKSKRKTIKVSQVLKAVARSFDVLVKDIKGTKRTKEIALARQVAMYILREEFNYKLEEVAGFVNRSDHTTVIHAVDKIKSKMMIQESFNMQIGSIISSINESSAITSDLL